MSGTATLPSKTEHLFGGSPEAPRLSAAETSQRFDSFLEKLDATPSRVVGPQEIQGLSAGARVEFSESPRTAADVLTKAMQAPDLVKALGADGLASITAALEAVKADVPSLTKDISIGTPLASGLVAYDLEAPAKMLTPRPTPLRNRIARRRGQGLAHKWKVIDGFTGTAGSSLPLVRPGITETTQNNFAPSGAANNLFYARGPKISYSGQDKSVPYKQFSLSDQVTWGAQYAGQGFQDARQLSRTSLMYASFLAEERMMLGSRGAAADGFAGALAAPGTVTVTARAPQGSETAVSGAGANIYVLVTAECVWGESVVSAVATVAAVGGDVYDVKVGADSLGATGYRVYVGTGAAQPGNAAFFYAGRTGYNTFTVQGALPNSGANPPAADNSATSLEYDGLLTVCAAGTGGVASGYAKRINAAFSTATPGVEFQDAFAAMYDPSAGGVLADPDRVMMNGLDRKQLGQALQNASASNYSLRISQDEISGVSLGTVVNTIINEVTGKGVDIEVHPWLPQGNAPIISDTLPIPDSQVSDCWAAYDVQGLMGVDWTPMQFTFDSSSYWFGTFVCYAPRWQGIVQGIKRA